MHTFLRHLEGIGGLSDGLVVMDGATD